MNTDHQYQAGAVLTALDGWMRVDGEQGGPELVGNHCLECGNVFFPPSIAACRNPSCSSVNLEPKTLSRHGVLWSFTVNHYPPPPPFEWDGEFQPYCIAAVFLEREQMIVLGHLPPDVDMTSLELGMRMELIAGNAHSKQQPQALIWQWRPESSS